MKLSEIHDIMPPKLFTQELMTYIDGLIKIATNTFDLEFADVIIKSDGALSDDIVQTASVYLNIYASIFATVPEVGAFTDELKRFIATTSARTGVVVPKFNSRLTKVPGAADDLYITITWQFTPPAEIASLDLMWLSNRHHFISIKVDPS